MSSIVEGYRVVKKNETVQDTFSPSPSQLPEDDGFVPRQGPEQGKFEPRNSIINKPEETLEDKAYHELMTSLGQRVKAIDNETHELTIVTGGASAIKIQVVGYEHPELVNAAKAQEDAVSSALPVTDKITDQVEEIQKYNTDQYMKHSSLNPKKFG
jgi:hypothetical protein